MTEIELWRKGAEARRAGKSLRLGAEELGLTHRDHDERKAFRSGWIDMEKFMFMSDLIERQIP